MRSFWESVISRLRAIIITTETEDSFIIQEASEYTFTPLGGLSLRYFIEISSVARPANLRHFGF